MLKILLTGRFLRENVKMINGSLILTPKKHMIVNKTMYSEASLSNRLTLKYTRGKSYVRARVGSIRPQIDICS